MTSRPSEGHPAPESSDREPDAQARAEDTLRHSEARFRQIAETINEVFWMADIELHSVFYVSPAFERVWGRTCASVYQTPRSILEAIHPADVDRVVSSLKKCKAAGESFDHEYRIVRPDGEIRWIWDRGTPVREEDGGSRYVGVARDVTERHRANDRLHLLARALESTTDLVSVTDLDNRFTFVNRAFLETYGYTADEVLGRAPALLHTGQDAAGEFQEMFAATLQGGWQGEVRNRRKDGSEVDISLTTSVVRDESGRPIALLGVARDITERRAAEQAVRAAEERMRFALEAARVGVWEWELETGRVHWTAVCEQMHGLAPGSFGGTLDAFLDCLHPDDRPRVSEMIQKALRDKVDTELEYLAVWPDGTIRRIACTGRFSVDDRGNVVRGAGTTIDITEHRSLEDQLRQAQKMEAIGQLAGGIAHDFNNLLTAILGYASLLRDTLPAPDPRRSDVDEINRAAERASALTRQLLAFSRKQILSPRVLHLGDVVSELTPMLRRLLGETIDLHAVISDCRPVSADPGQLEQVLMNLAVNARDAMPDGGRLTIETTDVMLSAKFAKTHPSVRPGPHVLLAVRDTGHGMDAATQKRLFEPFFTTKPKGKGTGLGLATVYGIVKQSGGSIWVSSEVGAGTSFEVYLPAVDAPAEPPPVAQPAIPKGSESILLVEDEDVVREFAQKVLGRYGYVVHAMAEPGLAIEHARTREAAIDLVLTDVVMPETSGRVMAAAVLERHPEARVLYMSGYTDDAIVRHGVIDDGVSFLQKPFSAEQLLRKVRHVLDSPRPGRPAS